jgi:tetratricopeptide (TPR) repeat protein
MDIAAHVNLPLAYFYARDMQRAFEVGKRSVDAHPEKVNPRYNFAWYAIGAGRFDVAEKELYEVLRMDPSLAEVHVCLGLIRLDAGKSAEAAEEYRSIISMGDYAASLASTGLADIALYEGRLGEAEKILGEGIRTDTENGLKSLAAQKKTVLAQTLLAQGRKDAALKMVDEAEIDSSAEGALFSAALVYLDVGRESKAVDIAKRLAGLLQPEPQAYAKLIEGEILLRKKDLAGAVNLFHEAQSLVDTWIGHLFLGRAYLEAGQFTEAHSEFDLCLRRKGEAFAVFLDDLPSLRYLPQVYYYLGRSQEGLKIPAAAESYREFLRIKVLATDDPMVEDARRRLGK